MISNIAQTWLRIEPRILALITVGNGPTLVRTGLDRSGDLETKKPGSTKAYLKANLPITVSAGV